MFVKNRVVFLATNNESVNVFYMPQMKKLLENGYEVILICGPGALNQKVQEISSQIHIVSNLRRGYSPFNDVAAMYKILKILMVVQPGLIIYATPKAALLGSLISNLIKIEIRVYQIWGVRWQNLSGFTKLVVKYADFLALKLSTNVIVVSKSVLEFLENYFDSSKMKVLGNGSTSGIDTGVFFMEDKKNQQAEKFILGYAGRISRDKGIEKLIDIFERLTAEHDVRLELVGDLDLTDSISEDIVQKIQVNKKIKWINSLSQTNLAQQMRKWDAQIFLSKREGLGNVILEAGACGIPTFCWKVVGTIDAIPEFASFLLIDIYNDEVLIQRIKHYLNNPFTKNELNRYSNWYIDNFNRELVLNNFLEYIETLGRK